MKCIECGHELKDGAIFCIRCGAMQVSMDGKPIEVKTDWPTVEAQNGATGFRSSTEGALHSAQSKTPRGFQPAPERNGGRIAIIIIVIVALIAAIAFGVSQCMGPAASGSGSGGTNAATVTTTTSGSTASGSAATDSTASTASTSSTEASTSAASGSTSAASASGTATASDASASGAATSSGAAASSGASASGAAPAQQEQPAQEQPAQPPAAPEEEVYNDYYVLPDSSYNYYSYDDLSGMSTYDLYIARNEIFARHGRMFNRTDLQDYFNSQAWYEPIYSPADFDAIQNSVLSDCEMQNARTMKQVEADKGSPYL